MLPMSVGWIVAVIDVLEARGDGRRSLVLLDLFA